MEQQKSLPIGLTSFANMVEGNYIYVDKTDLIAELAQDGYPCFLSRPRLFGKTTLVNTFQEIFANGLERFKGLKIERDGLYTDNKTYKVLHLDFSDFTAGDNINKYLLDGVTEEFRRNAIDFDEHETEPWFVLESVISKEENRSMVLLIDDYDAPLSKVLNSDEEIEKIRGVLSSFYSVIKELSDQFRFIFITGMSIVSELNNLNDLSLDSTYGALLGFTQEELEFYFKDYIESAAYKLNRVNHTDQYSYETVLQLLKQNYYGYCFDEQASTMVYNPWSILNFLHSPHRGFLSYWAESGGVTPPILVKYLEQQVKSGFDYERFLNLDATIDIEADYLVANMLGQGSSDFSFEAALYQIGYLSIKSCCGDTLMLGIPNLEVKTAFSSIMLNLLKQ